MGKRVHVIAHSHWDREWYFTTSRSKVYLMEDLAHVLDVLESDPEFTSYTLDGQSCLLDDYLAWRPQDADRIARLVKAGRLLVGPWYTQTDQMVICGESIVRNMYYGIKRSEDFGHSMNVAYVPDSFGQAGNMPQIYRQFGLKDLVTWRGISDDMTPSTDFIWRGSDGSKVLATQLRRSYSVGKMMPESEPEASHFWKERCLDELGGWVSTDNIYMPCGDDQAPIRTSLPQIVYHRNEVDPDNEYLISSPEQFMADMREQAHDLPELDGELLCAKHMRVHRSIFSSRSDLKVMNTQIQNYLVNVVEPLLALSHRLGFEYPTGAVESIWKLLFENAAHDSIGSSVVDEVNEDIYMRYKQACDIAVNLVDLHMRKISTAVNGAKDSHTVTVFNTLPEIRSGIVVKRLYIPGESFELKRADGSTVPYTVLNRRDLTEYVKNQTINLNLSNRIDVPERIDEATVAIFAEDVPAMGYEQYTIVCGADGEYHADKRETLENEFYCITVNHDGSLRILDKRSGYVYEREAVLVENGDDGDSFNYSPPRGDLRVFSTECEARAEIRGSDIYQRAVISFDMRVPANLEERARGERTAHMPVSLTVSLAKGADAIDLSVEVDNRVPDSHRLCILFDAQMATKFNYADEQFGCRRRDNVHEREMACYKASMGEAGVGPMAWEAGEGVKPAVDANPGTWEEPPVSIEPTQSYVALFNDERGLAVYPQGVREYEIVDKDGLEGGEGNLICLTLFRSYGFMGKEDLLYRPGRASGETTLATPDAQLHKKMTFGLGFEAFSAAFSKAHVSQAARAFATGFEAYEYASFLNGRLLFSEEEIDGSSPAMGSLMTVEGDLTLSAIKKAEDGNGIIVRLFNGEYEGDAAATLTFAGSVANAYEVDLRERKVVEIRHDDKAVLVGPIGHAKIVTVCIELA